MRNVVDYEICVNLMDGDDILDTYFETDFIDALWRVESLAGKNVQVELMRRSGNDESGEAERGYAAPHEDEFCSGHVVPARLKRQLVALNELIKTIRKGALK